MTRLLLLSFSTIPSPRLGNNNSSNSKICLIIFGNARKIHSKLTTFPASVWLCLPLSLSPSVSLSLSRSVCYTVCPQICGIRNLKEHFWTDFICGKVRKRYMKFPPFPFPTSALELRLFLSLSTSPAVLLCPLIRSLVFPRCICKICSTAVWHLQMTNIWQTKCPFVCVCRSSVTEALSKRLMWAQHLCSSGAIYDADEEREGEGGPGPAATTCSTTGQVTQREMSVL